MQIVGMRRRGCWLRRSGWRDRRGRRCRCRGCGDGCGRRRRGRRRWWWRCLRVAPFVHHAPEPRATTRSRVRTRRLRSCGICFIVLVLLVPWRLTVPWSLRFKRIARDRNSRPPKTSAIRGPFVPMADPIGRIVPGRGEPLRRYLGAVRIAGVVGARVADARLAGARVARHRRSHDLTVRRIGRAGAGAGAACTGRS